MSTIFTANRIAAILTWLSGLAAFVLGVAQTLPGHWPNYALAAAGLLTKVATAIKFLDGSQKFDAIVARTKFLDGSQGVTGVTDAPKTPATPAA